MSPLPVPKADGDEVFARMPAGDSFVADDMVAEVVLGNRSAWQRTVETSHLALAADDDFAGWMLPVERPRETTAAERDIPVVPPAPPSKALPFCFDPTAGRDSSKRRATPPSVEAILEAGFGKPPSSGHRWWIPGAAAVLAFGVFSVLLLNQSFQHFVADKSTPSAPFTTNNTVPAKAPAATPAPSSPVAAADSAGIP